MVLAKTNCIEETLRGQAEGPARWALPLVDSRIHIEKERDVGLHRAELHPRAPRTPRAPRVWRRRTGRAPLLLDKLLQPLFAPTFAHDWGRGLKSGMGALAAGQCGAETLRGEGESSQYDGTSVEEENPY